MHTLRNRHGSYWTLLTAAGFLLGCGGSAVVEPEVTA